MTLEQDLAGLRRRIEQAQAARARAEVQRDNATQALAAARQALVDQYDLHSADDIRSRLTDLRTQYSSLLAAAEQDLAEAGA